MSKSDSGQSVLQDSNYVALERHYVRHPIVIYTGAGVSSPRSKDRDRYGAGAWNDLVLRVLEELEGPDSAAVSELKHRSEGEWSDEPWKMADWVAGRCDDETFKALVVKVVQRKENFPRKGTWKQLSGGFLRSAATLNAVGAFCAELVGRVDGTRAPTYRVAVNRRVRAVVTSNYDPYLEAASTSMFIRPLLKPVGAFGSHAGRLDQIPVFHVHGYVAYPESEGGEGPKSGKQVRTPFVDPVIRTKDYEDAWETTDAYSPTMGPQIHCLRHYATLFIGFSFRDSRVNRLLRHLNKEREGRDDRLYHYALMQRDEVLSKKEGFFDELGVKPIGVQAFADVPKVLARLYERGLAADHRGRRVQLPLVQKRVGTPIQGHVYLSPSECWDILRACRNRAVGGG